MVVLLFLTLDIRISFFTFAKITYQGLILEGLGQKG